MGDGRGKVSLPDSQCLICGRIYYGNRLEKCPRCQGTCATYEAGDFATRLARKQGDRDPGVVDL